MAELERLANHFGDIGAICNDASFVADARAMRHLARARAARRRRLLRPPADDGRDRAGRRRARHRAGRRRASCATLLAEVRKAFPRLIELYDNTASLQDRTVTTGIVKPELRAAVRRRRLCRPRLRPRLRRAARARLCALWRPQLRCAGAGCGRRQCAGLDPHSRGRTEPGADRPDSRPPAARRRSRLRSSAGGKAAKASAWSKPSAAMCWSGCARRRRARSRAATCAMRRGSSGRCWRPRLKATSSPTSRSATNRSTAPIRGMISSDAQDSVRKPDCTVRSPSRRHAGRGRRSPSSRNASIARHARGSAVRCPSVRSTPAPAMAASWKSTRSTMHSTISSASACASSPRRAMPTC